MKNEVRPIDANATIEALRANFQQGSWYGCKEPCYQIAEDTIAEMPTLTDHFPNLKKMIPLTLEQLREMDGQPVWIQNIEEPNKSQWRLCHWDRGKYLVLQGISVKGYLLEEYGESWLAYAYPPAHIDREAWEPCEFCGKADFGEYGFEIGRSYVKIACAIGSWRFQTEEQFHFCPECGRPLTEEAWAELEKRMGV